MSDISKVDKNMAIKDPILENITWFSPLNEKMFKAYGSDAYYEGEYCRLSKIQREYIKPISENVEFLSHHTAGIQLMFETNSPKIIIDVSLLGPHDSNNMTSEAQCGFDLYVFDEDKQEYVFHNAGVYPRALTNYQIELSQFHYFDNSLKNRKYIINFPLYQGLNDLKIGLTSDSTTRPIEFKNEGRVVIYGTSITQGGCVTRPGLAYSNILSRWLNMEVYNQGYSGSALLEPEVGQLVGQIKNQTLLVIDAEANAGCEDWMKDNLENFIDEYKKYNPQVPIIICTRSWFNFDRFDEKRIDLRKFYRQFILNVIKKYKEKGYEMYFLDGDEYFIGQDLDWSEFTIDGVHPTDYGSYLIAKKHLEIIKKILK